MNINDVYNYFKKIDSIIDDGIIDATEYRITKQENSIFSSVLKENITFDEYCIDFVKFNRDKLVDMTTDNLYRMDEMPKPQSWSWDVVDRVLTKDEVDANRFNIKTKERTPINPDINFNTPDGEYMLAHLSFDEETFKNTPIENLPEGWNPSEIIEEGKDPGMNIRRMHDMGYTGKGITCAVVDKPIIRHAEIADNLVGYETMDLALAYNTEADFHGQATSGILCGKETGIAKDSKLVYFAKDSDPHQEDGIQALKRILEINKKADELGEPDKKIRVVSLSWGINSEDEGYDEYSKLLKELYDTGVFVATADFNMVDENITGCIMARNTLEKKDQNDDQNNYTNYVPTMDIPGYPERSLFVLSGDKTVASAEDVNSYRHDSQGSTSWSVPVLAGVYACALQCAEQNGIELTPQMFWDYALQTGVEMHDEQGEFVGKAIDAEALVKYIEAQAKQ